MFDFPFVPLSDALRHSSRHIPKVDKLKLLNRPGGESVTVFAEIALLNAFLAAVILSSLHHAVAATVRTPATLSGHRCLWIWYV